LAENHNDIYEIKKYSEGIFQTFEEAKISTDGLFVNADSGFDSKCFRLICEKRGIIPNVVFNYRIEGQKDE
jgi:hypothetical protein